jgi:hypothetical protein
MQPPLQCGVLPTGKSFSPSDGHSNPIILVRRIKQEPHMAVTKGVFSITRPSHSASRGRHRYFLARGLPDWPLATSPSPLMKGNVAWSSGSVQPRSLKERWFHLISFLCIFDHCFRKVSSCVSTAKTNQQQHTRTPSLKTPRQNQNDRSSSPRCQHNI